jgi:hypothetical protein
VDAFWKAQADKENDMQKLTGQTEVDHNTREYHMNKFTPVFHSYTPSLADEQFSEAVSWELERIEGDGTNRLGATTTRSAGEREAVRASMLEGNNLIGVMRVVRDHYGMTQTLVSKWRGGACEWRVDPGFAEELLHAAAPDLLAACNDVLNEARRMHVEGQISMHTRDVLNACVEAAIAKATGENA